MNPTSLPSPEMSWVEVSSQAAIEIKFKASTSEQVDCSSIMQWEFGFGLLATGGKKQL